MKVNLLLRHFMGSIILALFFAPAYSQTLIAKPNINLTPNLNGLYVYLPQHYNTDPTAKFPLLIMCQGQSQLGNGGSQLSGVLGGWGTGPWQINGGTFPTSFTEPTSGVTFEFIILIPQFRDGPVVNNTTETDINALLQYGLDNYRVDPARFYITGISSGAGLILDYNSMSKENGERFAAAVVMSPALIPSQGKADTLAQSNLPLWISVGDGDETMYPLDIEWFDYFSNATPEYLTFPRNSIFSGGHGSAWDPMYFPTYTEEGVNIYQWMLRYDRLSPVPVTGMEFNATANKNNVLLEWKTFTEVNNKGFEIQKSTDGINFSKIAFVNGSQNPSANAYSFTDQNVSNGVNYYRIKQIDKDGRATFSKIVSVTFNKSNTISVYPNPTVSVLNIDGTFSGKGKIIIYDATGKSVMEKDIEGSRIKLSVNNLPKGLYNGVIYSSDKRSEFTFVKN